MKKAVLFKKLKDAKVQCTACSHYCVIDNRNTGICGVRKNIKGSLYLMVYGQPTLLAFDPIEKKPLFHFLPGTKILSIGTVGCNLQCSFCQNYSTSQERNEYGENNLSPKEIVNLAVKSKSPSIAITYNEPSILVEYAYDIFKLARKQKIKTIFVTNGYESKESMAYISKYIDAMNIDLKSFSEEFYKKFCKARLQPVLETIRLAHKLGIWIEITTLIIPNKNDSEKEIYDIAGFIASIDKSMPWHVTSFHPEYQLMDSHATNPESLLKAYGIGKKAGLKYVYTGNVILSKCEATYCPSCSKSLVERQGIKLVSNKIIKGKCPYCNEKLDGIWK